MIFFLGVLHLKAIDPEIQYIGEKYNLPFFQPINTFEEQKAEYQRQSNVIGKAAAETLKYMLKRMQQVVQGDYKAGIIKPEIKSIKTGEPLLFTIE